MWSPTARGRRIVGLRHVLAAAALAFEVGTAWAGNGVGGWSALEAWPLIPIHAALTPDGRVLTYGTTAAGTQTGIFIYDVWDTAEGLAAGHLTLPNGTSTDIFCNVQIILPGTNQIFMAGGNVWTGSSTRNIGNNNSDLFNSTTNELSRGPALSRARWYASMVAMLDGSIYVQGGKGTTPR